MVRHTFNLEVERRHVVKEPRAHEVVGVGARLCAIAGGTVEEVFDGGDGLQEGRYADVIEWRRHLILLV